MFTVKRSVGRLVEAIMRSPVVPADLDGADRDMGRILSQLRGPGVIIADYRQTKFLLEDDAKHLAEMFRRHNDRIERSAILVSERSAVGVLQMERVIREAQHPARRAFREPHDAALWLGEVLSGPEKLRLTAALTEASAGA